MLRPLEPNLLDDAPDLPAALTVMDAIGDLPPVGSGSEAIRYVQGPQNAYQAARRANSTELTLHQSTRHTAKMMEIIRHSGPNISFIPKHLITSGFSSCYSRLEADEPSPTITVNFVHPASNKCIHPVQDRALTPREGARLQSFDDKFKFAGTNRNATAKQIGNAVPPLLGEVLGRAVAGMLGVEK
jgi:DNA (cytosine-5)-methyltransferase 1